MANDVGDRLLNAQMDGKLRAIVEKMARLQSEAAASDCCAASPARLTMSLRLRAIVCGSAFP